MRFMMWQQALLVIGFVALLVVYAVGTYRITAGRRSLGAILLRLIGMVAVGSVVWVSAGFILLRIAHYGLADAGVRYWLVEKTFDSTFGFPFTNSYWEFLTDFGERSTLRYLIAATVSLTLLLLGGLVVVADRALARGPFAIQRHSRVYGSLLLGIALAALIIQLWPQPLRNPDMPSISIPEGAIAVEYAYTNDSPKASMTSFTAEGQSASQVLNYYKDALMADKWQLEYGQAYKEYPSAGTVIFSKGQKFLELHSPGGPAGASTMLVLRDATPAEFAQYAELRKPIPTSVPAPIPTQMTR